MEPSVNFSGGDGAIQLVVSCINDGRNTACHLTNSGTTGALVGTLIETDDGGLYDTQGNHFTEPHYCKVEILQVCWLEL